MALLDGDKRSELPSMSWNPISPRRRSSGSVKDRGNANHGPRPDEADPSNNTDPSDDAPPHDTGSHDTGSTPDHSDVAVDRADKDDIGERARRDVPTEPPPAVFSAKALLDDSLSAASESPSTASPRTADEQDVTPAETDATDATHQSDPADATDATETTDATEATETTDAADATGSADESDPVVDVPEPLPQIVEATPSPVITAQIAADTPEPTTEVPTVTPAVAPTVPDYSPAFVPQPSPAQTVSLPPSAAAMAAAAAQVTAAAQAQSPKKRKDRSGSVARLGFFFLFVGALVSAAVIFGRPYLLPAEWEADAQAFAEPIQFARGTDFAEPVTLTPQPTETHLSMVAAQLLGDPAAQLPMWRALGLAGPDSTDDATLQGLIADRSPVLYSTLDGQVYYDEAFTRSDRSALILQAMATAALDQDFAFSADSASRTLDDAALTEAHARQQASIIARAASATAPLTDTDVAALAFLPVVLDYRLTAPIVFAELLPPVTDVGVNPLAELGTAGPGPLRVPPLTQIPSGSSSIGGASSGNASGAETAEGSTGDDSTIVTDRSFWYLSFASHLDPAVAYRMSTQLQGAGLQMVDGTTGSCAVAAFTTADAATTAALQADLGAWVAAAAPELGASVSALPSGQVELRSCDPAGAYTSNIRFGAARQLIAWRSIELAVTDMVMTQGGTEADVATAIALIGSTPSADAVVRLPAGTTPADLAAAARAAATDVIAAAASGQVAGG